MTFSRKIQMKQTIKHKQDRAHQLLRTNTDYKIKHPDEARDAALDHPNFTQCNIRIKNECEAYQTIALARREKTG